MKSTNKQINAQDFREFYGTEGFFTAKQLYDLNITNLPKLWDPFLRNMGLTILAGSSDVTKTTFCRQMSLSIAKGEEAFLGYKLNTVHKRICIISTEDDEESVGYSIRKQMQLEKEHEYGDRIGFFFINQNYLEKVNDVLTKCKCDLVILDSWGDIMTGNPNSYIDVRKELNPYAELARKHKCLFLIIHHLKKSSEFDLPSKNSVNGSQGLEAKARCVLEMRLDSEDKDLRLLTVLKSNYLSNSEKKSSIKLRFDEETRMFSNTFERVEIDSIFKSKKKGSRNLVWMNEMVRLKVVDSLSYEQVYAIIKEKYPNTLDIKITRFKTVCKPYVDAFQEYLRSRSASEDALNDSLEDLQ